MMPTSSTSPISALRPGLAKKATMSCLYSTTMTNAHSTRNTSIRTRKIRGEDNLLSSTSMAERGEGPDSIASVIRCGSFGVRRTMAQRDREKSWVALNSGRGKRNLRLKLGFGEVVFYKCWERTETG